MGLTYIYTLIDPITNEIRYVGKTTQDPIKRYSQHLRNSKKRKTFVNIWVNDLLNDNIKPIMNVVDSCESCNWIELEKKWAIKIYEENRKLCNLTYIGDKKDRNPVLSINSSGQKKRDKIFEEITWLKTNTSLSSNDIRELYGKKDWERYKKYKYKKYREKVFNTQKYGNMFDLHYEIKKSNLNDIEMFIWCKILQINYSLPNQSEYEEIVKQLIKKGGEFYDKLFYKENLTSEYYITVIKEITDRLKKLIPYRGGNKFLI